MRPPVEAWGVIGPLTPLVGGHRNTVLKSDGDRPMVFKNTRRSEVAVAWLLPVLESAQTAGFSVPFPVMSGAGRFVTEGWICEPFIAGKEFEPTRLPELMPQVKRLHEATRDLPQRPGFLSAHDLLTAEKGGDIDLSQMPGDVVVACRDAWTTLENPPNCAIHGDLHSGNLMLDSHGQPVLLDWDECRRDAGFFDDAALSHGSVAEDRALLAWEVACCWQSEPLRARQLAYELLQRKDGDLET